VSINIFIAVGTFVVP
jgi:hypothetical protein